MLPDYSYVKGRFPRLGAAAIAVSLLVAPMANAWIGNGIRTSAFPEVARLTPYANANCTSTKIAKNLYLTATHCVCEWEKRAKATPAEKTSPVFKINGYRLKTAPRLHHHPALNETAVAVFLAETESLSESFHELSIIELTGAEDISRLAGGFAAIDSSYQAPGTPVVLVGFGKSSHGATDSDKRTGTNRIADYDTYPLRGMLALKGSGIMRMKWWGLANDPTGVDVLALEGDSGGPLFAKGRLIAVFTKTVYTKDSIFQRTLGKPTANFCVPLSDASNRDFVAKTLSERGSK